MNFREMECFQHEDRPHPWFIIKADGPDKGELVCTLHPGDGEIAIELVKRWNSVLSQKED